MSALAKIHIAKKELCLEDDDYRTILERITGQNTAKGLTDAQAGKVLEEFKRRGWVPKVTQGGKKTPPSGQVAGVPPASPGGYKKRAAKPAEHPSARKARALWISLWQLGVVRDRSEKALESFGARQVKVERLVWADAQQMFKLIEALKAMAERNGWDQDVAGLRPGTEIVTLKRRLITAQCAKLGREDHTGAAIAPNEARLNEIIDGLARQIRGEA